MILFSFPRIYTEPAQSAADNFAAQGDVLKALHADQFSLFGSVRVHPSSQDYFAYTRFSASSQWGRFDFKRNNDAKPV